METFKAEEQTPLR